MVTCGSEPEAAQPGFEDKHYAQMLASSIVRRRIGKANSPGEITPIAKKQILAGV